MSACMRSTCEPIQNLIVLPSIVNLDRNHNEKITNNVHVNMSDERFIKQAISIINILNKAFAFK